MKQIQTYPVVWDKHCATLFTMSVMEPTFVIAYMPIAQHTKNCTLAKPEQLDCTVSRWCSISLILLGLPVALACFVLQIPGKVLVHNRKIYTNAFGANISIVFQDSLIYRDFYNCRIYTGV